MRDEQKFYVYVGFHPRTDEPCYVGKGQRRRIMFHNREAARGTHHNPHMNNIVKKHGPISFVTVRENLTEPEAFETEMALIAHFGRVNSQTGSLCNLTDGGEGSFGLIASAAHRANLSKSLTGHIKSASHRNNLSKALKGRIPSDVTRAKALEKNKGRALSDGHREQLSQAQRKIMSDPKARAKRSAALVGIKRSPETRAKMSAHKKTPEHIAKVQAAGVAWREKQRLLTGSISANL
jgi:hypothetical protein